jgi:hypothetical protein
MTRVLEFVIQTANKIESAESQGESSDVLQIIISEVPVVAACSRILLCSVPFLHCCCTEVHKRYVT